VALLVAMGWPQLVLGGCAKRYPLTPDELQRVGTESREQNLRVYTNKRLIGLYDEADVQEQYQVQKKIREASDQDRLKEVITNNTAGLILEQSERNGAPLLSVTFDPSCRTPACAYGFVQTETGHFRLVTVPPREGYGDPRSYRACVWKKRRLHKGKLNSLAEANEVFLVKKRNGKILTIDLTVKKVVDKRTKTKTRRNQGID
jgi:hypothetical protein